MAICPLTCEIVKKAIEMHENNMEICIGEVVDYHKQYNAKCALCERNELSDIAKHLKRDMAVENDDG